MSHYKLMINRHEHTAVRSDRAPSREITGRAGPAAGPSVHYTVILYVLAQPLAFFSIFLPKHTFCVISLGTVSNSLWSKGMHEIARREFEHLYTMYVCTYCVYDSVGLCNKIQDLRYKLANG